MSMKVWYKNFWSMLETNRLEINSTIHDMVHSMAFQNFVDRMALIKKTEHMAILV